MFDSEAVSRQRTVYVLLWALAATCFGLAITETTVFGLGRVPLLLMTTVFAALTEEYRERSDSSAESSA